MQLIDSHCHLDDEKFNEDRDQVIEEIKNCNASVFFSLQQ